MKTKITEQRKAHPKTWNKAALALAIMALAFISLFRVLAQSVPQPVLTVIPTGTNQFRITITNAVASTNYEIYRTPLLGNEAYPFTLHVVGTVGQSNFIVDMGIETEGWFKAGIGSDWDLDGVENSKDAQPSNPAVSNLVITIDSPTNGANLN